MSRAAVVESKPRTRRRPTADRLSVEERDELRDRYRRESELRRALVGEHLSAAERGRLEVELMEISPHAAEALRLNFREKDPENSGLSEREKLERRKQDARRLVDSLNLAETLRERIEIYRAYERRLLCLACSWWPEEMPELNGEWEWLAVLAVDLD